MAFLQSLLVVFLILLLFLAFSSIYYLFVRIRSKISSSNSWSLWYSFLYARKPSTAELIMLLTVILFEDGTKNTFRFSYRMLCASLFDSFIGNFSILIDFSFWCNVHHTYAMYYIHLKEQFCVFVILFMVIRC